MLVAMSSKRTSTKGISARRNEICFAANGLSPLKRGGHQREIDDRPKHCQAIRSNPENLTSLMSHDLCAEMRILSIGQRA